MCILDIRQKPRVIKNDLNIEKHNQICLPGTTLSTCLIVYVFVVSVKYYEIQLFCKSDMQHMYNL